MRIVSRFLYLDRIGKSIFYRTNPIGQQIRQTMLRASNKAPCYESQFGLKRITISDVAARRRVL
jgi:hypothetical protein